MTKSRAKQDVKSREQLAPRRPRGSKPSQLLLTQ